MLPRVACVHNLGYIVYIMEVGIREFRNNLAAILDKVDQGEVVTITHHGKPRATLQPVRERVETPIERGIREGWLHPGANFYRRRADRRPTYFLPPGAGAKVMEALLEDREED